MCGRFATDLTRVRFDASGAVPNHTASYNVAPTQSVPVVRRRPQTDELVQRQQACVDQRLRGNGGTSGMFRRPGGPALHHARDRLLRLGPGDPAKAALRVRASGCGAPGRGQPVGEAGVTGGQNYADVHHRHACRHRYLSSMHDRMSVVLEKRDLAASLDGGGTGLANAAAETVLLRWQVGARVNSPCNDELTLLNEGEPTGPCRRRGGPSSACSRETSSRDLRSRCRPPGGRRGLRRAS